MTNLRRRTARTAVTAVSACLLLAGVTTTTTAAATESDRPAVTAAAGEVRVLGGLETKIVQPYEPLVISDERHMGLLPEGRQNYVVSHPSHFTEDIEAAKGLVGDDIRPDSISLGIEVRDGTVELISGAWRTSVEPQGIVVTFEGDDFGYYAQMVRLPGEPGWGTYYFDARGWGLSKKAFTVQAVGADGEVFDTIEYGR